ncbi:hypothetical protein MTO96_012348 [Rhipicephalus appendiculatus]
MIANLLQGLLPQPDTVCLMNGKEERGIDTTVVGKAGAGAAVGVAPTTASGVPAAPLDSLLSAFVAFMDTSSLRPASIAEDIQVAVRYRKQLLQAYLLYLRLLLPRQILE